MQAYREMLVDAQALISLFRYDSRQQGITFEEAPMPAWAMSFDTIELAINQLEYIVQKSADELPENFWGRFRVGPMTTSDVVIIGTTPAIIQTTSIVQHAGKPVGLRKIYIPTDCDRTSIPGFWPETTFVLQTQVNPGTNLEVGATVWAGIAGRITNFWVKDDEKTVSRSLHFASFATSGQRERMRHFIRSLNLSYTGYG